jgi:hypothetical protein
MSEQLTSNALHAVADKRDEPSEPCSIEKLNELTNAILPDIDTLYRESFEQAKIAFNYLMNGNSNHVEQSPTCITPSPTGLACVDSQIMDERLMKQHKQERRAAELTAKEQP